MVGIQPGARTPSIMSTCPEAKASVRAVVSAMKEMRSCLRHRRPGEILREGAQQDALRSG